MPIAAISLGKRRVKVQARRRYPHRVRTPPGYEVLTSPANIRRIDCTDLSEMLACWLRNGLPTKTAYRNQRVSENRRLVDVRGVLVLGIAGITEPVEITLGELDLSPLCEPPERFESSENPRRSQLTTGLSGCGRSTGGNSIMRSLFRSTGKRRRKRSPLRCEQYGGSIPIAGTKWNRCRPRSTRE